MIKVVTVRQMREIEAEANASGIPYAEMMQHAGEAVAARALEFIRTLPPTDPPRVTVLVGAGNNGGDGLVAGREIAATSNAVVRFYLLKRRPDDDLVFKSVESAGLFVAYAEDDQRFRVLRHAVASADVLIDALFGIGIQLPLRDDAVKVFRAVQEALDEDNLPPAPQYFAPAEVALTPRRSRRIIAIDCPSGLDCDTGAVDSHTLHADETVTFIAAKPGLVTFPGAEFVGKLVFAPAGVATTLPKLKSIGDYLIDSAFVSNALPARPVSSNKGTFGKVLVVGGSTNYVGAPGLSAHAAYKMGAGLVSIAAPASVAAMLAASFPPVTWFPCPEEDGKFSASASSLLQDEIARYEALVIGPGMGRGAATARFVSELLAAAAQADLPVIIDADALNALSQRPEWWHELPERAVITPHPGEMSRLTGLTINEIQAERITLARSKSQEWGLTVLLKGAHTIVASDDGQLGVLPFKTSALATAGTGDVLSGMIGTLLAQALNPFQAVCTAGYIHGLAGEKASARLGGPRSVTASDVLDAIPSVLKELERA